ncbi:MAG: helix-turn-helix transcriptional regulator [Lachnospiraceae bacterium]|nr:helix-turn-helix transcriptional regulator [Lachnospiraceae bacterium]MBQ6095287.1 helix-turn-helix transcriptional regulator [Lachnospiraceae bacterium]
MNWNQMVLDLMKQKGVNQKQLSKLSGITESSISRYLNSDKTPRMDVVVNIAKALQVETDYFLKEEDKGQTAFNVISTAIARKGGELTAEEKNRLIALLLEGGHDV